jgi:hypothetical protein
MRPSPRASLEERGRLLEHGRGAARLGDLNEKSTGLAQIMDQL